MIVSEHPALCRNCKSRLEGEYCSKCGQRERSGDLHFSELAGELLGDFVSWDSRLWRTMLPLMLRPGFLTAEFIAGRKARYIPPLRLYLIISFVLFLALPFVAGNVVEVSTSDKLTTAVGDAEVQQLEAIEKSLEDINAPGLTADISLADEDDPQWLQELDQRLEDNAVKLGDDPGDFVELLMEYAPQMMFLLMPLFALLVKMSFLSSPFHYIQHLVFALHYHSFAYLLYLANAVAEKLITHFDGPLFLILLLYLPLALRKTYHPSLWGTVGKSLFIFFTYIVFLGVGFAVVTLVALALL